MPTEHEQIQDPQIHEPKDISGTTSGEVYVADGGVPKSGVWQKQLFSDMDSDAATAGQTFVADGAGGGAFEDGNNIHGEMIITNNLVASAIPLAVDGTLNTDSDYVKVTGNWTAGHLNGITFNVDELVVPVTGHYEIALWASFEIAVTSTLIGVKYAINDVTPYSTRKILAKSKTVSDINNIFGTAIGVDLTVGDTLSIYVAADKATNVIGREVGLTVKLLGGL